MNQTKSKSKRNGEAKKDPGFFRRALEAAGVSRWQLNQEFGQRFGGKRDIYDQAGYPKELSLDDFAMRYQRQGIAKRVCNMKPDATWRSHPLVLDSDVNEDVSEFEAAWATLVAEHNLMEYIHRADRLAQRGQYAVLLFGTNDVVDSSFNQPLATSTELMWVQPFSQMAAEISTADGNPGSGRYGFPEFYQIKIADTPADRVHWSRVLHVADGLDESEYLGTPILESCFNALLNIETINASTSEGFWRAAFGALAIDFDPDVDIIDEDAMSDNIQKFVHGTDRFIALQGAKARALSLNMPDPTPSLSAQYDDISAAIDAPKRIIFGSEMGQLASSQDRDNFMDTIDGRRNNFGTQLILEIAWRFITHGMLPTPKFELRVEWPSLREIDPETKAKIAESKARALASYAQSGSEMVMDQLSFLTSVMGITNEQAAAMVEMSEDADVDDIVVQSEQSLPRLSKSPKNAVSIYANRKYQYALIDALKQ